MSTHPGIVKRDWWEGDDPGMTAWYVLGPNGDLLVNSYVTGWTLYVYDLTAGPTAILGTYVAADLDNDVTTLSSATVDGYWEGNDTGYNVRHYLAVPDLVDVDAASVLKAGHSYRFVYVIETAPFDGSTAGAWGDITLVREGSCLARGS
jgi:hypothetical protein